MKSKLFCEECEKDYEVENESIIFMQNNTKYMSYSNGIYTYNKGCFFKELNLLKRSMSNN